MQRRSRPLCTDGSGGIRSGHSAVHALENCRSDVNPGDRVSSEASGRVAARRVVRSGNGTANWAWYKPRDPTMQDIAPPLESAAAGCAVKPLSTVVLRDTALSLVPEPATTCGKRAITNPAYSPHRAHACGARLAQPRRQISPSFITSSTPSRETTPATKRASPHTNRQNGQLPRLHLRHRA